jgi:D-alanyl-D-alanine carboxypeptidase
MRELISAHLKEAAVRRTAPMIAEAAERREEAPAKSPATRTDRTATANVEPSVAPSTASSTAPRIVAGSNDPIRPLLVKTISYRTAPVQTASLAPMPALVPVAAAVPAAAPQPSAAVAPAVPAQAGTRTNSQTRTEIAATAPNVDLKVAQAEPSVPAAAAEPAAPKSVAAAPVQIQPVQTQSAQIQPAPMKLAQKQPAQMQPAQIEPTPIVTHPAAARVQTVPAYSAPPGHSHGGWLIQIGAFDDEAEAKQHLSAAQSKVQVALAEKDPFTERVQKGDKALYRARFAGFDKSTAEAACRALKRSDFECMALKD